MTESENNIIVWIAERAEQFERDYKAKVLREWKIQEPELAKNIPLVRLGNGKKFIEVQDAR